MYDEMENDKGDFEWLWPTITQHKTFIASFTIGITLIVAIVSLFMTNIYKSETVILPLGQSGSRLGSLAALAGISPNAGSWSVEIVALLKSNTLKKEIIEKYHLLPVLFYKSWNKKEHRWKKQPKSKISLFISDIRSKIRGLSGVKKEKTGLNPNVDDGIKALSGIFNMNKDRNLGTINMSIEYPDPVVADKLLNDVLSTLRYHMTSDAIRIAKKKVAILKKELLKTNDPTIRDALYRLIVKQITILATARVNENFAFKVISYPYSPQQKYKPHRKIIVIISFILSLMFSILLLHVIELIKDAKNRKRTDNPVDSESLNNKEIMRKKEGEDL